MATNNSNNVEIQRVLEYSSFFIGTPIIDVDTILKQYDRSTLIRMAFLLSCHYGNLSWPDDHYTLFSEESREHIKELNQLFVNFYRSSGIPEGTTITVSSFRTALELWRHIFAIRPDEYKNTIKKEDAEYELFKVILSLNEKIVDYSHSDVEYKLDELLFLNLFITNDTNNFNFQSALQPQLYYVYHLAQVCDENEVLRDATNILFEKWGISSWQEYAATLMYVANETERYRVEHKSGIPILNPLRLKDGDETGLFSSTLIDALSIDENEYIPFDEPGTLSFLQNIDYRVFRSRPFVRLRDKSGYIVINVQLLCERIFNSLYFDFKPLIDGRTGSVGFFDYNKEFIEKNLFRKTLFNCIPSHNYTFPKRYAKVENESKNEPDFYCRWKDNLMIFECKAIKMNGSIRDDGDYSRFLDELHEKIVKKTRQLDSSRRPIVGDPEPMGIGQLIHHIKAIHEDDFRWDAEIPDNVTYYPIMVFEDVRFLQPGLLSIINRWFKEELLNKGGYDILEGCMPVMAISINTLYLYDTFIHRIGLSRIIDEFVEHNSHKDKDGNITLLENADFDGYLRTKPFHKNNDVGKWIICQARR